MKRFLEASYIVLAIAPFEALIGLAYSNAGPLIAYNIILAVMPFIIAFALVRGRVPQASNSVILLLSFGILKIISLIFNIDPGISAIIDAGLIIVTVSVAMVVNTSNTTKAGLVLAIIGSGLVLARFPSLVAIGLLLWGASFLLVGASLNEDSSEDMD